MADIIDPTRQPILKPTEVNGAAEPLALPERSIDCLKGWSDDHTLFNHQLFVRVLGMKADPLMDLIRSDSEDVSVIALVLSNPYVDIFRDQRANSTVFATPNEHWHAVQTFLQSLAVVEPRSRFYGRSGEQSFDVPCPCGQCGTKHRIHFYGIACQDFSMGLIETADGRLRVAQAQPSPDIVIEAYKFFSDFTLPGPSDTKFPHLDGDLPFPGNGGNGQG